MPTTRIEIVDTAVKTVMGSVAAGITTLLNENYCISKARERQLSKKRRDSRRCTLSIEDVIHTLLKHCSFIVGFARNSEKGVEASEAILKHTSGLGSGVYFSFKVLTKGQGRLLITGGLNQKKKLRKCGSADLLSPNTIATPPLVMHLHPMQSWIPSRPILDTREQFYSNFNRAY